VNWPPVDPDHLLVDAAQMQGLEEQLFASGLPQAALMEKVGQAMSQRLLQEPHGLQSGVVVLAGPGHNGGDGLVVARELFLRGISVRIWSPFASRKPLTEAHLRHLLWLGVACGDEQPDPRGPQLWLDALFGLGQTRPLPAALERLLSERAAKRPNALVSLDVPSGLCSDSGRPLGAVAATARLTLCVGLIKQGLCLDPALPFVGALERIDLGLAEAQIQALAAGQPRRFDASDLSSLPVPRPSRIAMKYQRGRLLVIAGSEGYPGAGRLCLQGALASGCGSVQAALPAVLAKQLWLVHPEVVPFAGADGGCLDRLDAVVFGPGLGGDGRVWDAWKHQLQAFSGLLVLDADGLNALASDPGGWRWLLERAGPTWLTPHQAEFSRLFPDLVHDTTLMAAQQAARLSGTVVLYKGAHTVIADSHCPPMVLDGTSACVARTGLGDVLAGFAAGWGALSRSAGMPLGHSALAAAALLHAAAAQGSEAGHASAIAEHLTWVTQKLLKRDQYFETKI
jgi:hydroxyethylthiazole kinase-like uncharacterized protein yjeF